MTTQENKDIVRRFYRAFEDNDQEALKEVLAADLVAYNPDPQNRDEHLQGISGWNAAFSDTRFEIVEQIAEGEAVDAGTRGVTDSRGLPVSASTPVHGGAIFRLVSARAGRAEDAE